MQYKSQYVTMTKARRYDYYYHMDIKLVHFLFAKITCKNMSCWEVTTKNSLYLIVFGASYIFPVYVLQECCCISHVI